GRRGAGHGTAARPAARPRDRGGTRRHRGVPGRVAVTWHRAPGTRRGASAAQPLDLGIRRRDKEPMSVMGDPLDFLTDDGWPYPDQSDGPEPPDPVELRFDVDDDLVCLHALPPRAF